LVEEEEEQLGVAEETDVELTEPLDENHEEWHTTIGDVFCIGGMVASIAMFWITLPLAPSLLGTHPVLLEAIRGSSSSMVTAGAFAEKGEASLALALIAGIVGLGFFNVFYWWGGRRYGNRLLDLYTQNNRRYKRWATRSERFLERWGALALIVQWFTPIPKALLWIGTGMSGLSLRLFLICNTIGCALWVGLMVGLGYTFSTPAVKVAKKISHYSLLITLGLVAVLVVMAVIQVQRQQRAIAADEQKS
jgi:membrane-associated protein